MTTAQNVQITKVATGVFSVTIDGKATDLEILNLYAGWGGVGTGNNLYGLIKNGKTTTETGSLQMVKKVIIKAAGKGEITVIAEKQSDLESLLDEMAAIEWEADDADWKAADAALIRKSRANLSFKRA